MVLVTMAAAIRKQPDEMEPGGFRSHKRLTDHRIGGPFSVENRFVDPGQVLVNDSSSTQIEMTNFGISHLALGQSNVHPTRAQVTPRISLIQVIVVGRTCEQRRVSVRFRKLPAMR